MTRLRGRRLADITPGEFADMERRIFDRALDEHLDRYEDHDEDEEPPE
jgi:hypothetical protein